MDWRDIISCLDWWIFRLFNDTLWNFSEWELECIWRQCPCCSQKTALILVRSGLHSDSTIFSLSCHAERFLRLCRIPRQTILCNMRTCGKRLIWTISKAPKNVDNQGRPLSTKMKQLSTTIRHLGKFYLSFSHILDTIEPRHILRKKLCWDAKR